MIVYYINDNYTTIYLYSISDRVVINLLYTHGAQIGIKLMSVSSSSLSVFSLMDLGLEQFTVARLFTRIFIPTSFLLVCILHLHYFHDRFLQLTDLQAVVAKEQSTIYRWDTWVKSFTSLVKFGVIIEKFIFLFGSDHTAEYELRFICNLWC